MTKEFTDKEIEEITIELEHIRNICDFQIKRIVDKKSINKRITLRQALEFIRIHTIETEGKL